MCVTVGKDHDVTRVKNDALAIQQPGRGAPFRQ
jgi:hypothetical protein